jgi:sporulation protein YlmC with PRC-barrel domain
MPKLNQGKGTTLTHSSTLPAEPPVIPAPLSGSAFSLGVPQTISLLMVDPQSVSTGYRVSNVIGAIVMNDANDIVGKIDDLIIALNEEIPFAVLSVGGFLGIGTKHVAVRYNALEASHGQMLFRGATTDSLKSLPDAALTIGDRTSKVIGATVVNRSEETVGTVDDLIVTPNRNMHFAVLSIGGFLGMGGKYVVVPYRALELHEELVLFPDATKELLKSLPEFNYSH